jgi:hypothetical protein
MRAIYIGYCLLRELNHRVTGVSRESSPATTLFVTGVLLRGLYAVFAPALRPFARLRPRRISLRTAGAAYATGRYITSEMGGEPLRQTPHAHLFIALGLAKPALTLIELPVALTRAAGAGVSRSWRWLLAAAERAA